MDHDRNADKRSLRQRYIGAIIGAAFGLGFVLANARSPLSGTADSLLRTLAILGFGAVLVVGAVARRRTDPREAAPSATLFGSRYWLIVAGEVLLLAAGLGILRAVHAPQEVNVAWIAFVVGLHFIAFAAAGVWDHGVAVAGSILVVLGVAGLALAAASEAQWIPLVSGVLSGLTLLAGTLTIVVRAAWPRTQEG